MIPDSLFVFYMHTDHIDMYMIVDVHIHNRLQSGWGDEPPFRKKMRASRSMRNFPQKGKQMSSFNNCPYMFGSAPSSVYFVARVSGENPKIIGIVSPPCMFASIHGIHGIMWVFKYIRTCRIPTMIWIN